jgi:GST-like protein
MLDVYFWPTPNGHKITIMLEECGLPYRIVPVDIGRGDQFKPEFLAISPNNRMPAIVDDEPLGGGEPLALFESAAILTYLGEKTGKFLPTDTRRKYDVLQWLAWQVANLGPMLGQNNHFAHYASEKLPYAIDRYVRETNRLFGVMERRLQDRPFLAGEYSIADMASFPWMRGYERYGQKLEDFPHVHRWFDAIAERPAVKRGLEVGDELRRRGPMDDATKKVLFGQTSKTAR